MARLNTLPRHIHQSMPWNHHDAILTTSCMHMFIVQMNDELKSLRDISPLLRHIKIGKKKAEAFLELLKVLKYHAWSTKLMINFFSNRASTIDCYCKACNEDIFKPLRMSRSVYDTLKKFHMPIPIPKSMGVVEVHVIMAYMSFVEAQVLPFTSEH
jgi:hypothetical protein